MIDIVSHLLPSSPFLSPSLYLLIFKILLSRKFFQLIFPFLVSFFLLIHFILLSLPESLLLQLHFLLKQLLLFHLQLHLSSLTGYSVLIYLCDSSSFIILFLPNLLFLLLLFNPLCSLLLSSLYLLRFSSFFILSSLLFPRLSLSVFLFLR